MFFLDFPALVSLGDQFMQQEAAVEGDLGIVATDG
jgi:hypothetical protein